jgi:hypothetical protein
MSYAPLRTSLLTLGRAGKSGEIGQLDLSICSAIPEPVFLNVYGAQEWIPRNEFRQPM